jgi:hypothetical protein
MDGNKKLIQFGFAAVIVFLIVACSAQKPNYGSLYVATTPPEPTSFDTNSNLVLNKPTVAAIIEFKKNVPIDDSLIHKEDLDMLAAVANFLQSMHSMLDTTYFGSSTNAFMKDESNATFFISDSLYLKRTERYRLNNNVTILDQPIAKERKDSNKKVVTETTLNQLESEKVVVSPNEVFTKNDTTFVSNRTTEIASRPNKIEEITISKQAVPESTTNGQAKEANKKMQQQLGAKDVTIQALERQLQFQATPATKTEVIYVDKSVPVVVYKNKTQENTSPIKQESTKAVPKTVDEDVPLAVPIPLLVKNDTNQVMEKELQIKNDSIQELNKRLLAKQEMKIDTVYKYKSSIEKVGVALDTVIVTAYYKIGQFQPNAGLLDSLNVVLKEKTIVKVEISGFTDSSGNAAINKRLTESRINYIYTRLKPYVALNKIFVQNFGQTFASEESVAEERRVVVKVYRQQ